jgi:small redox-active disulfide protein 2
LDGCAADRQQSNRRIHYKEKNNVKTVKILGSGCANCKKLEALTREAAASCGVEIEVVKVTDINAIVAYDLLSTPGLVVDERLVSSGRIPKLDDIKRWIAD